MHYHGTLSFFNFTGHELPTSGMLSPWHSPGPALPKYFGGDDVVWGRQQGNRKKEKKEKKLEK